MKLTEKQKRFADYYIESGNATESAIKAKYSKKTAKEIGSENLTKPHISEYINKRLAEMDSKRVMGATEALQMLTSIARGEIFDEVIIPSHDSLTGYIRTEKRADIKDRLKAVESILKRYPNSKREELQNALIENQIEQIKTNMELTKARTGLIKGAKKDTALLEALIGVVKGD